MTARVSAGLLMFRTHVGKLQVLLAHPGGPFFKNKDAGAWTIPKGEIEPSEDLLEAAKREFREEMGFTPVGSFLALTPITQKSGKVVHAWGFEGDCDPSEIASNSFTMEWPPKSGRQVEFPEIDRAEFFDLVAARQKIIPAQVPLIDALSRSWGERRDRHRLGFRWIFPNSPNWGGPPHNYSFHQTSPKMAGQRRQPVQSSTGNQEEG